MAKIATAARTRTTSPASAHSEILYFNRLIIKSSLTASGGLKCGAPVPNSTRCKKRPFSHSRRPRPARKIPGELLAEAQAKLEQQRDAMLRALADAENARKRAQTEAATAQKYALERFAEALLPVMDSLEAALRSRGSRPATARAASSSRCASSVGAREVRHPGDRPAPGERFDPHRHQAMAAVEARRGPEHRRRRSCRRATRCTTASCARRSSPSPKRLKNAARNPISDTDLD